MSIYTQWDVKTQSLRISTSTIIIIALPSIDCSKFVHYNEFFCYVFRKQQQKDTCASNSLRFDNTCCAKDALSCNQLLTRDNCGCGSLHGTQTVLISFHSIQGLWLQVFAAFVGSLQNMFLEIHLLQNWQRQQQNMHPTNTGNNKPESFPAATAAAATAAALASSNLKPEMSKAEIRKVMRKVLKKMSLEDMQEQSISIRSKIFNHKRYKQATGVSIFLNTDTEVITKPIIRHVVELERSKKLFIPMVIDSRTGKAAAATAVAAATGDKTTTSTETTLNWNDNNNSNNECTPPTTAETFLTADKTATTRLSPPLSKRDQRYQDTASVKSGGLVELKRQCGLHLEPTRMQMVRLYSMYDFDMLEKNEFGVLEPNSLALPDCLYEERFEPRRYNLPNSRVREVACAKFNDLQLIIVPGLAFTPAGERLGHGKGYYDEFLANWFKRSSRPLYSIGVCFGKQLLTAAALARSESDYCVEEVITAD